MAAPTAEERLDEARRIYRWRVRQLLRAGYDRRSARMLAADAGVDLHAAIELTRRGCPPATAVRILL